VAATVTRARALLSGVAALAAARAAGAPDGDLAYVRLLAAAELAVGRPVATALSIDAVFAQLDRYES
jgi:hypothetical protein